MSTDGIRVVIAGGGTGGHFFSGMAVGEAFKAREPSIHIIYVGTERGIEARVGPREGLDVRFIKVSGIKGKGLFARIRALAVLPMAILQSMALIRREKPNFVIGVGGYASGPVVLAARLMGKQTGIVEQNSVAGLTNRILGRFAHQVFVAFERARDVFPRKKVIVTGNPIREGFVEMLTLDSTGTVGIGDRFRLLIVGGSQGARALNDAMIAALPCMSDELRARLYVVHQTGRGEVERVRAAYEGAGVSAEVHEFIHGMANAYRMADIVLCRAGALTVSELSISQRGSLLVPYPHAVDNHQEYNAMELVRAGAGEMILQQNLTGELLSETLGRLNEDRQAVQQMAWKAATLAKPAAATEVVDAMYRSVGMH